MSPSPASYRRNWLRTLCLSFFLLVGMACSSAPLFVLTDPLLVYWRGGWFSPLLSTCFYKEKEGSSLFQEGFSLSEQEKDHPKTWKETLLTLSPQAELSQLLHAPIPSEEREIPLHTYLETHKRAYEEALTLLPDLENLSAHYTRALLLAQYDKEHAFSAPILPREVDLQSGEEGGRIIGPPCSEGYVPYREGEKGGLVRVSHAPSEGIAALPTEVGPQGGEESVLVTRTPFSESQILRAECASSQREDEKYGLDEKKVYDTNYEEALHALSHTRAAYAEAEALLQRYRATEATLLYFQEQKRWLEQERQRVHILIPAPASLLPHAFLSPLYLLRRALFTLGALLFLSLSAGILGGLLASSLLSSLPPATPFPLRRYSLSLFSLYTTFCALWLALCLAEERPLAVPLSLAALSGALWVGCALFHALHVRLADPYALTCLSLGYTPLRLRLSLLVRILSLSWKKIRKNSIDLSQTI